jgi:hypothetical protein
MPLAELAEWRMEDDVTGSELELHRGGTASRAPTSRGKTAGFARSGRCTPGMSICRGFARRGGVPGWTG